MFFCNRNNNRSVFQLRNIDLLAVMIKAGFIINQQNNEIPTLQSRMFDKAPAR
jgi:hypothetical protein